MSKIKTLAALVLITITLASCNDKSKLLVNTWKIDDLKLSKPIPPQAQGFFQAMVQQMKDNVRLTYKADGTFTYQVADQTQNGKWTLSKDGKQLVSTDDKGHSITYTVVELTKDKFVSSSTDKGDTVTFYMSPSNGEPIKPSAPAAAPMTEEAPAGDSAAAAAPAEAPASTEKK